MSRWSGKIGVTYIVRIFSKITTIPENMKILCDGPAWTQCFENYIDFFNFLEHHYRKTSLSLELKTTGNNCHLYEKLHE